jgi:hypothetical protein
MSDIATKAATAYCHKYENATYEQIESDPETYLRHTTPYLTVRMLHQLAETLKRHETALKSLETDSRWIKWFAIITGVLTFVLVILTIVLGRYALDDIIRHYHTGGLDPIRRSIRILDALQRTALRD